MAGRCQRGVQTAGLGGIHHPHVGGARQPPAFDDRAEVLLLSDVDGIAPNMLTDRLRRVNSYSAGKVAAIADVAETEDVDRVVAETIVDLFVREIYGTRRKDVLRLIISEGPRFPKLAEFYYREVVARVIAAVRGLLRRAAARGEIGEGLGGHARDLGDARRLPFLCAIDWRVL